MDWNKLKAEYIAGGTSYRKLAEKYGVPFSTLKEHARRESWTELREKARHKADTVFAEKLGKKQADKSVKIDAVADKLLDKISYLIENHSEILLNSQSLKHFTSALKDIKDIKGLKTPLDIKEQEARIDKLRKDAMEENTEKTVTIVMEGDVEEYGN